MVNAGVSIAPGRTLQVQVLPPLVEKTFQKRLVTLAHDSGWMSYHLSPSSHPGWPDLILFNNGQYRMIELKEAKSVEVEMKSLFTEFQLPFIAKFIRETGWWIDVVVMIRRMSPSKPLYILIHLDSGSSIAKLMDSKLSDYSSLNDFLHMDLKSLLEGIL